LLLQDTSFQALFVVTAVFPIAGLLAALPVPTVEREAI
jgi:hypothetical protein